jgi:hypothetical protein
MQHTFLRGAANGGRSRLFRRLDQPEIWSAGRNARPATDSDRCLENPGWKEYAVLGESACPAFFRGGSRAGASTYLTFDAKMGGIGFHPGSV